ncbi:uncharacterized protein LOC131255715 isoform X1 [Magnolia sinica]|uniref:uncharacterized protein LOC131255715 isoform X1 n=1 Tax=Magnolia sinica TaxID=86752 RepID=UPI00265A219C|nr:uncharacterized protein LOC131255715 isoform X1 [Magnolia sinica]
MVLGDYGGNNSLLTLWEALPFIAVVSGQNSAKSSILESIVRDCHMSAIGSAAAQDRQRTDGVCWVSSLAKEEIFRFRGTRTNGNRIHVLNHWIRTAKMIIPTVPSMFNQLMHEVA